MKILYLYYINYLINILYLYLNFNSILWRVYKTRSFPFLFIVFINTDDLSWIIDLRGIIRSGFLFQRRGPNSFIRRLGTDDIFLFMSEISPVINSFFPSHFPLFFSINIILLKQSFSFHFILFFFFFHFLAI